MGFGFKSYKSLGSQGFVNAGSKSALGEVQPLPVASFTPNYYDVSGQSTDGYTVYTFTSTATNYYSISYTFSKATTISILGVGGGGGGGFDNAGGGGAGGGSNGNVSGTGGSGIVVVTYPNTYKAATITGGGSLNNIGGNYVYTFLSSGTIIF